MCQTDVTGWSEAKVTTRLSKDEQEKKQNRSECAAASRRCNNITEYDSRNTEQITCMRKNAENLINLALSLVIFNWAILDVIDILNKSSILKCEKYL